METKDTARGIFLGFQHGFVLVTGWISGYLGAQGHFAAGSALFACGLLTALKLRLEHFHFWKISRTRWKLPEAVPEFGIEPANFRIDSSDWKTLRLDDGTRVKRNPEGDVTELLEGPFKGEQHFTQQAAIRETAKAGKRMPTKEEWLAVIKAVAESAAPNMGAQGLVSALGVKLAGLRLGSSVGCFYWETNGYFWSSSSDGPLGRYVFFGASKVDPEARGSKAHGLSVRCHAD